MNRRGFTLVELIATIAILGLIMTILIPSIIRFTSSIKEREAANVIKEIEEAASKYAFDKNFDAGKTLIFVDELVAEGYYGINDEMGEIINPENNEKLNCYIVEMTKEGNYYKASFKNDRKYELEDGNCDISKLNIDGSGISIEVYINGNRITNVSNWLRGNSIRLNAISNSINIDCINNNCIWTSSSGFSKTGSNSIEIRNINLLKTKYTFQYSVYGEEKIDRYTANIDLKFDNEAPVIYNDDIIIYDKNILTSTKKVLIDASDGNGSGIAGYYIGIYNNQNCNSVSYDSDKEKEVSSNGNYLICVKDNVGNTSSYNIQITNIGN